jgi:hypothetical protein
VISGSHRQEWMPRSVAFAALAAAAVGLVLHALVGFRGAYLSWPGGVWLTLARDLSDNGVLFRDLVSDLGYGGTRYFPLFFVTIAFFLKLGVPAAAAGWLAGIVALSLLVTGAYQVARASGAPPLTASVFAAAAGSPYFALEAVFGIRADVMAAGLNLWGVGLFLPAWRRSGSLGTRVWPAAVLFALAFATKVTALTMPASIIAAALVTGRARVAARFAPTLAGSIGAFLLIVEVASRGRALRVWAACMFAGSDSAGTLSALLSGGSLTGLLHSHLFIAVGASGILALLAALVVPAAGSEGDGVLSGVVPAALWLGATLALFVTLSSPGTIPSNQVIEWIAISVLALAMVTAGRFQLRSIAGIAVSLLVFWMALQNVSRAREMLPAAAPVSVLQRERFVERVRRLPAPILAESALWPILAGREVVQPDPFAARVVLHSHPQIEMQLIEEIRRRKYSAIILEFDPKSKEGLGMYGFVHFGESVISAVEANYRLDEQPLPNAFVFTPRAPGAAANAKPARVDMPRAY